MVPSGTALFFIAHTPSRRNKLELLKEKYAEWVSFIDTREAEREKLANPAEAEGLQEQIRDKKAEVLRVQAELQMLKAQLTLALGGLGTPYNKSQFDYEWSRKKTALKAEVEALIAEQLEAGVSVPKLMKDLNCKSPNWLYTIKDGIELYRDATQEEMAGTIWEHSDATSVHRYALGHDPAESGYAYVMLKGAIDSEFEGTQCIFEFGTGHFITGNRTLFDSVTSTVKKQRSQLLADILMGVYSKRVIRDTNPYYEPTN